MTIVRGVMERIAARSRSISSRARAAAMYDGEKRVRQALRADSMTPGRTKDSGSANATIGGAYEPVAGIAR